MATDIHPWSQRHKRKCETHNFWGRHAQAATARWNGRSTLSRRPLNFQKSKLWIFMWSLCFFSVSLTFIVMLHQANWPLSFQFSTSALRLHGIAHLLCETPVSKTVMAAHLSENVTALWLVRRGRRKEQVNYLEAEWLPGEKGFFVIYLLLCMPRMINHSLQLARRSRTGSSCARQNNLLHMMNTWGGLVSKYFLQLLSGSRSEKSREGMRREDKGKEEGRGEKPQSQGRRARSGAGRWGPPRLQKSPEPRGPSTWQEILLPSQPHSQALGLFSPWTPKSIQFSNVNSPSCCTAKRHPLVNLPIWHWLELMVENFEIWILAVLHTPNNSQH